MLSSVVLKAALSMQRPLQSFYAQAEGCWWERLGEQEGAATDEALLVPDVAPGGILEKSAQAMTVLCRDGVWEGAGNSGVPGSLCD